MYNNNKGKKHRNKSNLRKRNIICAIFLTILVAIIVYYYRNPVPQIVDEYIKRPYSQLLTFLEEEPADISSQKYEPTVPKIVQKDIRRMLKSNGELEILYYGTSSHIIIEKNDESDTRIKLTIAQNGEFWDQEQLVDNISMFKSKEDNIVIYGSYNSNRLVECYEVDEEMEKFEGREVKAEELKDAVNELRSLYDKFLESPD